MEMVIVFIRNSKPFGFSLTCLSLFESRLTCGRGLAASLSPGGRVNSAAVGIAVGFGILGILFSIAIVQFCCKYKCKKCKKCCKKKSE